MAALLAAAVRPVPAVPVAKAADDAGAVGDVDAALAGASSRLAALREELGAISGKVPKNSSTPIEPTPTALPGSQPSWQDAAAHRAWEQRPVGIGPPDPSTETMPLKAPLAAVYVGHPLGPDAMAQRQAVIDALLVAIKVCLICLAVSVCCMLRLTSQLTQMKEAIAHRLWKRR